MCLVAMGIQMLCWMQDVHAFFLSAFPPVNTSMCASIKCASYSIQGLSNVNKWKLLWHYVHTAHLHIVFVQEHNQHTLARQTYFFEGYDIFYAGSLNFSGVRVLVSHELLPTLLFNDPQGRWLVIQCQIGEQLYEVAYV